MKSIFFAVAVASLIGAAIASCPNACSGHGSCGNHDRCKCYANFVGGDCSEMSCPYGRSEQECSGRGICDRGAGSCECADGYTGASCQRVSCPNDCSGQGSCDTSTGLCHCAGGFSGNDCGTRMCPKGDDPLTHEVENSGDGTQQQAAEVQSVTFNAGRGLGGTATLTYNDLYGQSWTTRPFSIGGDNTYRLEIAVVPTTACANGDCTLTFTYGTATPADFEFHTEGGALFTAAGTSASDELRDALLKVLGPYATGTTIGKDRGNTIYVKKHYSSTSAKLGGSIHASARVIYDITIPVEMAGHDDNGGLTALTVTKKSGSALTDNNFAVGLHQMGDHSTDIKNALTSLPNAVIPSVTVAKELVTDTGTNSAGTDGNAYKQTYSITFDNTANAGDQNMLSCDASPCNDDGCLNRGPGVSEVRYMQHDHEHYGEGINFVSQGYFIMDIGEDAAEAALSAGSIKIMWDTGAGISSAIFAVVGTASEVQTALRTITGWEAVTVELWGTRATGTNAATQILSAHQFKVTFPAGYDDLGKSPTFHTMSNTEGAYADAGNVLARLYDQRFSNSIWLGKTTGYFEVLMLQDGSTATTKHTALNTAADLNARTLDTKPQSGNSYYFSTQVFGTGGTTGAAMTIGTNVGGSSAGSKLHFKADDDATSILAGAFPLVNTNGGNGGAHTRYAYLESSKTSRQTSDYFAVGSTIEVLPTTWNTGAPETDVDIKVTSNNAYRKFRVTGHVTNQFNTEFAKLDSFPADDGIGPTTALASRPDYNLKITSNNGTVHSYSDVAVQITLNEIQILSLANGLDSEMTGASNIYKLRYKGEETQDLDHESTPLQVAEEINGFSALSGPVTVAGEGTKVTATGAYPKYKITFAAEDGDVAQLEPVKLGSHNVYVTTRENGWSIEGPVGTGLDSMQAGGIINVTAREECKFEVGGTDNGLYYLCYDGVCGATPHTGDDSANVEDALATIKDDNGVALFPTTATSCTYDTKVHTVKLPMGYSCDGLEMRIKTANAVGSITKTVDKHNNGKQFKITRSFLQSEATPGAIGTDGEVAPTFNTLTFGNGKGHSAVALVDSLLISDKTSCDARVDADDAAYPMSRVVSTISHSGAVAAGTTVAVKADAPATACTYSLQRYVITLDSMPTRSLASNTGGKTLLYTSPVGSCSVAETTKGTYESYECSNRGACDGKSGICGCYEGYSGQSCETQTVLV